MISVTINGANVIEQLASARHRLKMEIRKATKEAGDHLKEKVGDAFEQGGPGWAPLAPTTLVSKWRQGYSSEPLIRTGKLKNTMKVTILSYRSGVLQPGSGGYARGRTCVQVAKWHEGGTSRMPARPIFAPVARRERKKVADIYREAFLRAFGGV